MKRIALLAQNEHDAISALLMAQELARQGWAAGQLVSLDRFLQQRAERIFEGSGLAVEAVEPRRPLRAPFYLLPRLERLAVVVANQRSLSSLEDRFDAMITGCDGALERVLINSLRRRHKPAYLVINGLHFSRSESGLQTAVRRLLARLHYNHLFFSELGQGMCHRVFAPGDHSRLELMKLGVPAERIDVTGSPRFASTIRPELDLERQILDRLVRSEPLRLLYLMGAWEWHGLFEEMNREMAQLEHCAELAQRWPGRFELLVRLHPRSSEAEKKQLESISKIRILSAERPLRDDLKTSDVVLAVASTGLLEAIALGRLVLVVDLFGVGHALNLRAFEERGMWVSRDAQALRSAFERILSPDEGLERRVCDEVGSLWHFVSKNTPDATSRILDRIRADLGA